MRQESENWLKQSLKDFEVAKKTLDINEYYLVAFLCQQAIEKGLKALYIEKNKQLAPQHHSLIFLAESVGVPRKFYSFLKTVNKEFVVSRYPDAAYGVPYELYDKSIALEMLTKGGEVMEWIKSQISK